MLFNLLLLVVFAVATALFPASAFIGGPLVAFFWES